MEGAPHRLHLHHHCRRQSRQWQATVRQMAAMGMEKEEEMAEAMEEEMEQASASAQAMVMK